MKKLILNLCVCLCCIVFVNCTHDKHSMKPYNEGINIIPTPQALNPQEGTFKLKDGITFGASTSEGKNVAMYFISKMERATGYSFTVADKGAIQLVIDSVASFGSEGYQLNVTPKSVEITASTPQGLFYGMQTFMQLLPAEIEHPEIMNKVAWEAPCVTIVDRPRFSYRGIHVDPCRHFLSVEDMKKQIDVFAMFKINRLHWHLTEDQGWRIEIKKYPKLTEIGSKRIEGDGSEYGGFYTQEEIKDIVQYAADRFITIIPELEIPGHELAAIAAYPELSCKGKPVTPRIIWGVEDIVMCPGKEDMFTFLEDVIDEMIPLFPGTYFHIGGDECPKSSWKACPRCQKRIREEGLVGDKNHTPEQLLQTYVVTRIERYLEKFGKKIIGWDEILDGKPDLTATIMSWRGDEGGIAAALAGHDAIMTPGVNGLYLDYYQGDSKIEPVAIGGSSLLEKTYSYEPVPDTLVRIKKDRHIIGVQANVWSEYLYTPELREYHTYPRAMALAEIGWTNAERKDYKDFERRIDNAYVRLDGHGINYHIPLPEQPNGSCNFVAFTDTVSLEFTTSRPETMVYTVDGTEPTPQSAIYQNPLVFHQSGVVKIATLLSSGKMSKVRTIRVEKQTLHPSIEIKDKELKPGLEMEVTYGTFLNIKALKDAQKRPDARKVILETKELTSYEKSTESMRGVKQYAAVATGFFEVPSDGVYYISSNLEEVWVDGKLLIDNGGEVKRYSRHDTSIALQKGKHELKAVFLGHIIGGWPSNWNDGSISLRKSDEMTFKPITAEQLWH